MTDWRPIETLPTKDAKFMFWLDWSEDCALLNAPLDRHDYDTRLFIGKAKLWGQTIRPWRGRFYRVRPLCGNYELSR